MKNDHTIKMTPRTKPTLAFLSKERFPRVKVVANAK
jgi:hypothetical protein